jgi:tRNA dimethylallyltransferase
MQIYRGMDIGTAKPTRAEMALVRHHMIDVADPWEHYSTGAYIEAVVPVMDSLHAKGKIPLFVGGTGLYLKAMTRGIFKGPQAAPAVRDRLMNDEANSPGSLYQQLQALDPVAAARIEPNDLRRIVRALEVCLSGEGSMSHLQKTTTEPLPYEFIKIGLTRDRAELYRMINCRVDIMLQQGLVDEVRDVIRSIQQHVMPSRVGDDTSDFSSLITDYSSLSALQAIGYKELIRHFAGELSLSAAVDLIKQRSRNYAKRQFTWFRQQEQGITWVDITGMTDPDTIFRNILTALANQTH